MPFRDCPAYTEDAVQDCLAQSIPTRVLLVDQGSTKATSDAMRTLADHLHPRVLLWTFNPALPSLSAAWNRALQFVWELGGTEALVVNNDVRLHRDTGNLLRMVLGIEEALFVSAVGVREAQFDPALDALRLISPGTVYETPDKGGPDFSCFLLSKAGHDRYPFDETFIPCYCEDLDMHRRYMLGGDGDRIFSINLPFLHYASGTIKQMEPAARAAFNRGYDQVVATYTRKWGGKPNEETYRAPFGTGEYPAWLVAALLDGVEGNNLQTTPELQRYWQGKAR